MFEIHLFRTRGFYRPAIQFLKRKLSMHNAHQYRVKVFFSCIQNFLLPLKMMISSGSCAFVPLLEHMLNMIFLEPDSHAELPWILVTMDISINRMSTKQSALRLSTLSELSVHPLPLYLPAYCKRPSVIVVHTQSANTRTSA